MRKNTMLLVDPVMGDDGRTYGIYSAALLDGMKALSRKADVITPNLTEACLWRTMISRRFTATREGCAPASCGQR